jgi:hypothetical protein
MTEKDVASHRVLSKGLPFHEIGVLVVYGIDGPGKS